MHASKWAPFQIAVGQQSDSSSGRAWSALPGHQRFVAGWSATSAWLYTYTYQIAWISVIVTPAGNITPVQLAVELAIVVPLRGAHVARKSAAFWDVRSSVTEVPSGT
jgi:hypothetical protein